MNLYILASPDFRVCDCWPIASQVRKDERNGLPLKAACIHCRCIILQYEGGRVPFLRAELFKHHTRIDIRYRDLDALGHVNNAAYLTYLEQARVTYFRDMAYWDGYKSELGIIVARICIDYKLALRLEDQSVKVWTRVSRLGNKSFTLENIISRSPEAGVAGHSETIMVAFDYARDQSVMIPDSWRQAIATYEPGLNQT